jgi:hypothetical protein
MMPTARGLARLICDFVGRKNDLPLDDLKEWYEDLARLSQAGRYLFSINRYFFRASKPGS